MARHVYRLYAARKPIMVCEYGASHLSKVDGRARPAWAGEKIAQMYAALHACTRASRQSTSSTTTT
jgi:hypothetical protein